MTLKSPLLAVAAMLAASAVLADGHAQGTFIDGADVVFEDILPDVASLATVSGDRETG